MKRNKVLNVMAAAVIACVALAGCKQSTSNDFIHDMLLETSNNTGTPVVTDHITTIPIKDGIRVIISLKPGERISNSWGSVAESNSHFSVSLTEPLTPGEEKPLDILNSGRQWSVVFPFTQENSNYTFWINSQFFDANNNDISSTVTAERNSCTAIATTSYGSVSNTRFRSGTLTASYTDLPNGSTQFTVNTSYTNSDLQQDLPFVTANPELSSVVRYSFSGIYGYNNYYPKGNWMCGYDIAVSNYSSGNRYYTLTLKPEDKANNDNKYCWSFCIKICIPGNYVWTMDSIWSSVNNF